MRAFQPTTDGEADYLPFGPPDRTKQADNQAPALAHLNELANQAKAAKYPGVGRRHLRCSYSDADRHRLTHAIVDFLNLSGHWSYQTDFERVFINNPLLTLPDVIAVIAGQAVAIAIETDRDKITDDQRASLVDIARAGGRCLITGSFQHFHDWFQGELQSPPTE